MLSVHNIEVLEFLERQENKRKCQVKDRMPVMEEEDVEFHRRYRFTKRSVMELLHMIEDDLTPNSEKNNSLSSIEQLLIALRFYATGAFQFVLADLAGVSQSSVSRTNHKVSRAIASLRPQFIQMPETKEECIKVNENFFRIAKFPSVIGCIDCTHIPIISPGGDDAERFRNRKGFFSLNVQTVVSADLIIQNVVARWPGSTHDSTIFSNSTLPVLMQNQELKNYHLLGDSGYPCSTVILTPLGQTATPAEVRYNASQISLKIAQYLFVVPGNNASVERLFSLIQAQWTKENRLTVESVEGLATVKFNFKQFKCKTMFDYLYSKKDLLKQIRSSEKYAWNEQKSN